MDLSNQKLLIANRGEIALRILRTAHRLKLPTIAVYTPADATSPHVSIASEAVALPENLSYLDPDLLVRVAKEHGATLLHPGYGFLSENAEFARAVEDAGITWLGPSAEIIGRMGLKHEARRIAEAAGVPVVLGTGLLANVDEAIEAAESIGWPVMLKSTAGGGGMGLVICRNATEMKAKFEATQGRAKSLFKNEGIFIERYFPASRHVEVQVFGDGQGHAIHMGERECSVQRRHQKVIEESPSPFMLAHPEIREPICVAAARLCKSIKYGSAGTVEFIVDDASGAFFFLEMNTRLQVEHPVTEALHPGLDLVELMLLQGLAQRSNTTLPINLLDQALYGPVPQPLASLVRDGIEARAGAGAAVDQLEQHAYESTESAAHAIEVRVYCEDPAAEFKPCPGVLQLVRFPSYPWLRIESWVETGTTITPHYDPLACKLIAAGSSRHQAVARMERALSETAIHGPPNNIAYLRAVLASPTFRAGGATTNFLDTFPYTSHSFSVLSGGVETTIQDFPGRTTGLGMPRSGPMDALAFRAANILVSNEHGAEALELALRGCTLVFHVSAVVAVCGAPADLKIGGRPAPMWKRLVVGEGERLLVGAVEAGMRVYLAVRGGFPEVPRYLGSKSTSMGLGGYQGRALTAGDRIALGDCAPQPGEDVDASALPPSSLPEYPAEWDIACLAGPHDDPEFLTPEGIDEFYATRWRVSASSNRMGIRLEGPKLRWARQSGGEGGSHPSNVHDAGYALGSVNVNGDTPVILTNEGPDMGGYVCLCVVATAERWKLGQLRPGCTVQFRRVGIEDAMRLDEAANGWLDSVRVYANGGPVPPTAPGRHVVETTRMGPKLKILDAGNGRPQVVFRQAGDAAILVEYGPLQLDFALRARIHAFEQEVLRMGIDGVRCAPCIRSTMVHYDPSHISQSELLAKLVAAESSLPASLEEMTFPARKLTLPIVLDDRWNREALERYARSIRDTAVYLPSNIEYLAKNNGLADAGEALGLLVESDWMVFGVGFYLACPFLVPVDPRCRLVGQKMNPSRTYTPRGAIGIAGLVAAIYPVESPGGYQLYGRTLPAWQTWGKGADFELDRPWLLNVFDQIHFEPVSEDEYLEILRQFDAGRYKFKVEDTVFSMKEYTAFVASIADEVDKYKTKQALGVEEQEAKEADLLRLWEECKTASERAPSTGVAQEVADAEGAPAVTSPMSASVWKIRCRPGDAVQSSDQVVVILEAMKTEINVEAGEENVGKTVRGFGKGVREGASVSAGDVLVIFE